jgi:hypothetical protein
MQTSEVARARVNTCNPRSQAGRLSDGSPNLPAAWAAPLREQHGDYAGDEHAIKGAGAAN